MTRFLIGNLRWLLAGFLMTMGSAFGQTYFVSLSNSALIERFGLSHGSLGLVYALATTSSALILLEFGKIVDRVRARMAAMITVAGLSVACLVMAGVQGPVMLFAAYLLLRLFGQGMMGHVAMTATGRWFEARRGMAASIVSLGHAAGIAIVPAAAVALIALTGNRMAWTLSAAILALGLAPLLWILLAKDRVPDGRATGPADRAEAPPAPTKRSWRRREVLREPVFWVLILCAVNPAAMMTALFFHQLHLTEVKDWGAGLFAATFAAFALARIVASLFAGGLIDRFSARAMMAVYQLPMAAGLALLWPVDAVWAVPVAMVLIGLTAGTDSALSGTLMPELFGLTYLGEVRALTFAAIVLASAVSPLVTGYLIDAGIAFPAQLAGMAGLSVCASGVLLALRGRLDAIATDTYSSEPGSSPS